MRHSVAQKRGRRHPHGMQSGTEAEYGGYPRGELWLDGKNRVTGEDVMLHMPQFTLAVDGSFNFFTEDFNEITFKGRSEIADGEEAAFYVELKENR